MKTLIIPTDLTPEQAIAIDVFLGELQEALYQCYGEQMRQCYAEQYQADLIVESEQDKVEEFNDEIPF